MLLMTSEYPPAQFTTMRVSKVSPPAVTRKPDPVFRMSVTWVSTRNSTPFLWAFSARAKVTAKGLVTPPSGTQSTPFTPSPMSGCSFLNSSVVMISARTWFTSAKPFSLRISSMPASSVAKTVVPFFK